MSKSSQPQKPKAAKHKSAATQHSAKPAKSDKRVEAAQADRSAKEKKPAKPAKLARLEPKAAAKPVPKPAAKPAPAKPAPATKPEARPAPTKPAAKPAKAGGGLAAVAPRTAQPQARTSLLAAGAPSQSGPPPKRSKRGSALAQRRGPDGQLLAPGDIVIPGGAQSSEEILYLLRGCVAAEHPAGELGVAEVLNKRALTEPALSAERIELSRLLAFLVERFERGIDPMIPPRQPSLPRRTFVSVVDRARSRHREIGAFLRGLDLGGTETSHMDPHGEASLQSLMEWKARLERLTEADEPQKADFQQFHKVLDQLELNTEALIVDVEQTLRRLRDRLRAR